MNDRCSKAIWFFLFVLVGTGVIKAESRWIRLVSGSRGVIIFVHGLTGDATSTWTSSTRKYWPEMLIHNSAFDGQDIYVYEYVSPKMTGALSLSQLTDEMHDRLEKDGVLKHDELTFVSHSMGGILTREFIFRYQNEIANKVRMLFFLATPTTGSEFAKLGRFSLNPQLKILVPNDDPDSFLNTLEDNWKDLHLGIKSYCAYETQPSWPLGQVVVEKSSAVILCGDNWRAIDADHKTIAKPADTNSPSYIYFESSFLKSAPPAEVSTSSQHSSSRKTLPQHMQPSTSPTVKGGISAGANGGVEKSSGPPPTGTNTQIATSPCIAQANGGNATIEGCNAGPPPLEIKWSVRNQAGGNDLWKFERIVTVTPNVEWHPVSVAIHCDQEVKSGMPEGVFYNLQTGFDPTKTIMFFYLPNPPQAANAPLSFEMFSDREFNVINVELAAPPPTPQ